METKELHENYILIHKFRYPDEPMKAWVEDDIDAIGFYHEDWNELRALIERIKVLCVTHPKLKYSEFKKVLDCKITISIEILYIRIVKFIKWYNEQTK